MDRQRSLALGLVACLWACGGKSPMGRPLAPGQEPSSAAVSLRITSILSKNALAYQVAIAAPYVVSVELKTAFELVVRKLPGSTREFKTQRIPLDAATYDVNALVLDAEQARAYVASSAGWVRSYDLHRSQMLFEWRMGSGVTALAMSNDKKYLLIGTETGVICLRRLSDGAQLQCMVAHAGRVSSLAITDNTLASATWKGELSLWGLPALNKISVLETRGSIADLAFSPDATQLAVARNQRPPIRSQAINDAEKKGGHLDALGVHVVELYRVTSEYISDKPTHSLSAHRSIVSSLCWIGNDLLSGSWDRSVALWNARSGSRTMRVGDFSHIVRDIAVGAAQATVAIASWGPESEEPALSWGHLQY